MIRRDRAYALLLATLALVTLYGLALIIAGAIGNALDRLFLGAVVDFLDATKIGFPWIFNMADATLDVGIGLVLLGALAKERHAPA